jgi:hypothetical protein
LALASLHESFMHPALQAFDRPAMHDGRQLKANLNEAPRSFRDFEKKAKTEFNRISQLHGKSLAPLKDDLSHCRRTFVGPVDDSSHPALEL